MHVKVFNDNCTPEIDEWLSTNVGFGNWKELFNPFHHMTYRHFDIYDAQLATMFALRFICM